MIKVQEPNFKVERGDANSVFQGTFTFEPLEKGFGLTLGNSLRRVLLSAMPGLAISGVRIRGVLHEYSFIPGVKEDVLEILLNLKQVVLASVEDVDEPIQIVLSKAGAGVDATGTEGWLRPSGTAVISINCATAIIGGMNQPPASVQEVRLRILPCSDNITMFV